MGRIFFTLKELNPFINIIVNNTKWTNALQAQSGHLYSKLIGIDYSDSAVQLAEALTKKVDVPATFYVSYFIRLLLLVYIQHKISINSE